MTDQESRPDSFFAELRRRKVVRVTIIYAVVGFAIIQAANIVVDAIDLPLQLVTFVTVMILFGLPIAIVLAWSYDVVPDSVIREAESANVDVTRPTRLGVRILQVLAAVAVVVLLGYSWFDFNDAPPAEPRITGVQFIDSVAVMPLENLTGDAAYDHLGIGITEGIITHLARIPPLKVISRHSVEAVDRQDLTSPQIANALGVRHIIEGSVRLDGETLRITLQHINAETDEHAWAEDFQGDIGDLLAVQEDVARLVTDRVVEMIPGIQQPDDKSHAELGPGQEAYLAGRRFLGQRTSAGFNNAIESFTRAIELDPGYAPAYADLASTFALSLIYRYDVGMDGYEAAARSMALAERALELDSNLAAGYAARAYLGLNINRPAEAIAADFERAAQLQPNAASIPSWRSLYLAQLGRREEAFAEARRAVDLDPLAPSRQLAVASISFGLGRFDEAIAAARMATTLEPRLVRGRALEARSLLLSSRADACANLVLGPHRVLRATCLEANGQSDEAQAIVDKVLADVRNGKRKAPGYTEVITYEDLAVFYALRGDAKNALTWAAHAFSLSPNGIEPRLLQSALFDSVREDEDFSASMEMIRNDLYDRVRRDSRQIL